jgi:hypothetical protein
MLYPRQNKECVFLHCAYALIERPYRSNGFMTFLTSRLAYAVQLWMPEQRIGVVFCSIHFNSYRMADFEHFPKYQSDTIQAIVKELLDSIFGSNYEYYHHLITHYIVEDIRVRSSEHSTHKPSLNERMFQNEILGKSDLLHNGKTRSAPLAYLLGADNYLYVHQIAHDLNIHFETHISQLASQLNTLLHGVETKPASPALKFSIFMKPGGCLLRSGMTINDSISINSSMNKM